MFVKYKILHIVYKIAKHVMYLYFLLFSTFFENRLTFPVHWAVGLLK